MEPEASFSEKVTNLFVTYPILFIPILGLLVGGVLLIIRNQNSIDIDFDDEVEESVEDEIDTDSELIQDEQDENEQEEIDDGKEKTPSSRRKVQRKPKDNSNSNPVVARRKMKSKAINEDGPITKVKRRRLDDGISKTSTGKKGLKTSKRKVVAKTQKSDVVKTRRVVTYSDQISNEDLQELDDDEI